jgi:SAM-dependent methyltransferase
MGDSGTDQVTVTGGQIKAVYEFFCNFPDFRTLAACSRQTALDIRVCQAIKGLLYKNRKLGAYYFEPGVPPHRYMREYVLRNLPWVSTATTILEVGPGDNPVFDPYEYLNWYGVDRNYQDGTIDFRGRQWGRGKYPPDRLRRGGWETLSQAFTERGAFDIVIGCHSYEHVFTPVGSLKEAGGRLRSGGYLVLFVPDGFSDDPAIRAEPTHSLFLVPPMIREFIDYAGCFRNISIESFRPNFDLAVLAERV